jgi:hypothetical protein
MDLICFSLTTRVVLAFLDVVDTYRINSSEKSYSHLLRTTKV